MVCWGEEPAPGLEGPVAGDAQGAAFVGGGDEPEQLLRAGVVQGCEPDLVADDQVVAEQGVDDPSAAVVGQAPVEGLDQLGGGEVADPVPGLHGGDAERDEQVALAGARRSDQAKVLPGGDPFQAGEVVEGGRVDRGQARSNSSRVLTTGNAAVLSRVRALEASRAVISASMRVRSSSSGPTVGSSRSAAVPGRVGASRPASAGATRRPGPAPAPARRRSRRPPDVGVVGGVGRVVPRAAEGVVGQGRVGTRGSSSTRASPAVVGCGVPAPAARMERTSAARQRPNATARARASRKACSPCAAASVFSSTNSGPSRVLPAAAAQVMNASPRDLGPLGILGP